MERVVSVVNEDKSKAINVRDYLITDYKGKWRTDEHLRINGWDYAIPSSRVVILRCREWAILNIKRDATFEDFCEHFKEELSLYWTPDMSYSERASGRFYTACYILAIDSKFQPKPKAPKVVGTRSIDVLFEDNKYERAKSYDERTKECQNYLKYYFLGMISYPVIAFWLYLLKDIIHAVLAYIGFASSMSLEFFGMIFANSYEDNMFKGAIDGTIKSLTFDSTVAWEHSMVVIGIIYLIIYAFITIVDRRRLGVIMNAFWIKGELDDVLE